ncbi:MAG: hypothetical protein AAGH72_12265 [Verrucomicrobiota bacterium]
MNTQQNSANFLSHASDRIKDSWVGGITAVVAITTLLLLQSFADFSEAVSVLVLLVAAVIALIFIEVILNQVHHRSSAGLNQRRPVTKGLLRRCGIKYLGFLGVVGCLAFIYWLIPEYQKELYLPAFMLILYLLPVILLIAIPYIIWTDTRLDQPEDAYYAIGAWLLRKKCSTQSIAWKPFILGWGVKVFFLPIMLGFLCHNVGNVMEHGFQFDSFQNFFITSMNLIFTLDTIFGAIGYLMTLRVLDAHIRTPDQTVSGWLVTLICYPPFLSLMGQSYYHFKAEQDWQVFLIDYPLLYVAWGTTILFSLFFYVWATVCFGCRFSNLTNRGIINFGPYRFMKHPAYVFKCISWWLLLTPFVSSSDPMICLQACLLLTLKCGVYVGRAKVEERLLMQDPAYVEYSAWMDQNSWWAQWKQWIQRRRHRSIPAES